LLTLCRRTFQELLLSRRMLVFTEKEVFFYCSYGLLTESVSYNDDPCEPLPFEYPKYIQLCGRLNESQEEESSPGIATSINTFNSYITLLNYYIERVLTYENDVVNAFTGVMNAHSSLLGPFYWGNPQRLFTRALLPQRQSGWMGINGPACRRPDLPSWSLLSWNIANPEHDGRTFDYSHPGPLFTLVHIYAYENSTLRLLLEPLDHATGIEGYCTQSIEYYNKATNLEALPLQPSVEELPPQLVPIPGEISVPMLVFWTHVARFTEGDRQPDDFCPKFTDDVSGVDKALDAQVEVVLIAACINARAHVKYKHEWAKRTHLHGIAIERHLGCARRIGTALKLTPAQWMLGNPKKELICFI
jgi:hypothetical protein